MNLRQLEAFRATMRAGSITAAAAMLHISQPSVSRLVADLERSVGFALFIRSGRGLSPTAEARRFHRALETMMIGVDRLRGLAESIRITAGSVLTVGIIPSVAAIEVPKAVAELCRRRPEVQIMLYERNTPAIVEAVQLGQFDLGIVGRQPPYEGVDTLWRTAIPYVCVMPESHPLAGEPGPVELAAIADRETFVTLGGAFPDEMLGLDRALSLRLRQRSRLSAANMPVAACLVHETGALAIVDPFSAELGVRLGGVVFRPIRESLTYHLAVVTRHRPDLAMEGAELAGIVADRLAHRVAEVQAMSRLIA